PCTLIRSLHDALPISLLACILCAAFMGVYAFQPWRSTYAGRAAMVFTSATFVWALNATLILWWPGREYGYPGWETGTELVYVYRSEEHTSELQSRENL